MIIMMIIITGEEVKVMMVMIIMIMIVMKINGDGGGRWIKDNKVEVKGSEGLMIMAVNK